jgi:DNA-binding transcriptional ArsR family regulator
MADRRQYRAVERREAVLARIAALCMAGRPVVPWNLAGQFDVSQSVIYTDLARLRETGQLHGEELRQRSRYRVDGGPWSPWFDKPAAVAAAQKQRRACRRQKAVASGAKMRVCIVRGCGREFLSDGPHHRMCGRCRKQVEEFVTYGVAR